jgi:photosynthetic reaction center H subunit
MIRGAVTSYIDVAQIVLYAFFVFFAGLVFYLRREDRREGYPLESEAMGRIKDRGFLLIPTPKVFRRPNGEEIMAPNFKADTRPINAEKVEPWPGSPLQPIGDPMLANVGPGSYAERADVPEQTYDGHDLLAPMRVATNFTVPAEDVSPVGFAVVGADGKTGGVVTDLWVDRGEIVLRYYEAEVGAGAPGKRVLVPVAFSKIDFARKRVKVQAILGAQLAGVPSTRHPDKVTLLEEEKITAYYGAGVLYASPERGEPVI